MNLARKLATGAIAAGLTAAGALAATPASATVVNSTCNLSSVVNVSYGSSGHYCYVWDGGSANTGWMNIVNSDQVCSNSYTGYVHDTAGRNWNFYRGACTPTYGANLSSIVFTGN
ncbi:hypothetical protein [Streptomyces sp. NBC_00448]|uniref:hypothetical protein n=1 Tax=Streptomyces sp. NBC_00448 TaxID=2903652 RepID=UPI002E1B47AE